MLDTNMIDVLLDEPALFSRLQVFAHEKPIGLLMTHLQIDEINEMGEAKRARKNQLTEVLSQLDIHQTPLTGSSWIAQDSTTHFQPRTNTARSFT